MTSELDLQGERWDRLTELRDDMDLGLDEIGSQARELEFDLDDHLAEVDYEAVKEAVEG